MIARLANLIAKPSTGKVDRSEHVVVYCCDQHVRELAIRWLRQSGSNVEGVEDADEAYWALARHKQLPHVLIVDGTALNRGRSPDIGKLRRIVPDLRVVAVQIANEQPATLADAVGADAVLERPLDRASLLRAVRHGHA